MEGKVKDVASIAQQVGMNERYVANVFQCAFLAPDIVEAIMDGRISHRNLPSSGSVEICR
jgi:hypothetical protein